jgi:hypothetical protein
MVWANYFGLMRSTIKEGFKEKYLITDFLAMHSDLIMIFLLIQFKRTTDILQSFSKAN